eukprot:TRINITY_DN75984_c0_g1_i1.p1 TRINITY_DN75984_c0_g1~~TRINITY_DN75984_c0_g1_i1.p1  ORF type:complete len:663 (-),score=98.70 TRINITY_DN75984_c0_g1_i1:256-2130(-)
MAIVSSLETVATVENVTTVSTANTGVEICAQESAKSAVTIAWLAEHLRNADEAANFASATRSPANNATALLPVPLTTDVDRNCRWRLEKATPGVVSALMFGALQGAAGEEEVAEAGEDVKELSSMFVGEVPLLCESRTVQIESYVPKGGEGPTEDGCIIGTEQQLAMGLDESSVDVEVDGGAWDSFAETMAMLMDTSPDGNGKKAEADAVAEVDRRPPENSSAIPVVWDATVAFDETVPVDSFGGSDACRRISEGDVVLSFVSVSPNAAASFDVARGPLLEVFATLPDTATRPRVTQISCGRDVRNAVVFDDSRVSLRHCVVRVLAGRDGRSVALDIVDLSSNGTWVNGRKLTLGQRHPLGLGDRVAFLPAAQVGRSSEIAFLLLLDTRGSCCTKALSDTSVSARRASDVHSSAPPALLPALPKHVPLALEEDLHCSVCMELVHRCLTLIPCGHNFCTTCFARWRQRSSVCPECREDVNQAVKNDGVDSVVEYFSRICSSAARSEAERAALNADEKRPENQVVLRWLLRDNKSSSFGTCMRLAAPVADVATPARSRTRILQSPVRHGGPTAHAVAARGSSRGSQERAFEGEDAETAGLASQPMSRSMRARIGVSSVVSSACVIA